MSRDLDTFRVSDESDRATNLELEALEDAKRTVSRAAQQKRPPSPSGVYLDDECDGCGLTIPQERMQVAPRNDLCIHCANSRENFKKFYAR